MFINTGTFLFHSGTRPYIDCKKRKHISIPYFIIMGLCSHMFNEIYLIGMFMYVQISISYAIAVFRGIP